MLPAHLAARAVVRLSPLEENEDVAGFLQGLVTNDVTGPLPIYAGLLSAQGKTLFDLLVWSEGRDLLLDCEASIAEELVRRLSLYRLRRKIGIGVDTGLAVYWSPKEAAGAAADPRLAALGWRWLGPVASAPPPADEAWLAHRLAQGVAEGRSELGEVLWLETNAAELNGVCFAKGCYVGQENTARMNWRQKVNRRLVVVPLAASDPKRQKVAYAELGFAVDHLRTEDIAPEWRRDWMNLV
ncbi:YgfZ/GcvT domain-containing protein [Qipengyuania sediminis]|uniref:CAF17-like 4Fe-4S cluster assembly/insertion protein YgfZ n=1 Tax=Qipengyuania sediminis TaxID=1532023 RepID=UPI00105A53BD|nr:folate-binding protein [Qipengyuania sediminis]